MRTKDKVYTYTVAILAGIMIALVILAASGYGYVAANAEEISGISPNGGVITIESDAIEMTHTQPELYASYMIIVDINESNIHDGVIEADIHVPQMPPMLYQVVLSDWWHISHAYWEITGENTVHVIFPYAEIKGFYNTKNLYLVFVCSIHNMK